MEKGAKLFTNRDLRRLIVPLVIEQVLVLLVGMADTAMVSYAGEAAVSGVSLVDMINYLVIAILTALATGGAVIISQYLGSGQRQYANRSASQLFTLTTLFALGIAILCLVFHKEILRLLFGSIEADVMRASRTYLFVTALSFPFIGLYNAAAAQFRSMQRTKVTMYVSFLSNAINVAGNAIGVFVLRAGVLGVAVPTLIARATSAILLTALAFRTDNTVFVRFSEIFSWDSAAMKRILRIAVPSGIENGLFALGRVLVVSIIALFGTSQIAANGVANGVDLVAICVTMSVSLAMITVVGQCVGAQEYAQADYYIKKLLKVSYIATAALTVLVIVLLPQILKLYSLSEETYRLCTILIIMHDVAASFLHPSSFNTANALRAAGDVRFTMFVGIGSMFVCRLGCAVLLGIVLNLGVIGVWIAMCLDWVARSLAFFLRYRSGKWKTFRSI